MFHGILGVKLRFLFKPILNYNWMALREALRTFANGCHKRHRLL